MEVSTYFSILNDTNEDKGEFVGVELVPQTRDVLVCFMSIICFIGSVSSSRILKTLKYKKQAMSKTATRCVASVVISNIFFVAYLCPTVTLDYILGYYPAMGRMHCLLNAYLYLTCLVVRFLMQALLSWERYFRMWQHWLCQLCCSKEKSGRLFALAWLFGWMAPLPAAFNGSFGYDPYIHSCVFSFTDRYPLVFICIFIPVSVAAIVTPNVLIYRASSSLLAHFTYHDPSRQTRKTYYMKYTAERRLRRPYLRNSDKQEARLEEEDEEIPLEVCQEQLEEARDAHLEKDHDEQIEKDHVVQLGKSRDKQIEKDHEVPLNEDDSVQLKKHEVQLERDYNARLEGDHEVQSEKNQDVQQEKDQDVQLEKDHEVQPEKNHDVQLRKDHEVQPEKCQDTVLEKDRGRVHTKRDQNVQLEKDPTVQFDVDQGVHLEGDDEVHLEKEQEVQDDKKTEPGEEQTVEVEKDTERPLLQEDQEVHMVDVPLLPQSSRFTARVQQQEGDKIYVELEDILNIRDPHEVDDVSQEDSTVPPMRMRQQCYGEVHARLTRSQLSAVTISLMGLILELPAYTVIFLRPLINISPAVYGVCFCLEALSTCCTNFIICLALKRRNRGGTNRK